MSHLVRPAGGFLQGIPVSRLRVMAGNCRCPLAQVRRRRCVFPWMLGGEKLNPQHIVGSLSQRLEILAHASCTYTSEEIPVNV